jgi:broad specificity phosphatase PhoE
MKRSIMTLYRAQETAAILNFKNAKWHTDFYLREQDKGLLGGKSYLEREREYSDLQHKIKKDTFYIAPPGTLMREMGDCIVDSVETDDYQ